MSDNVQAYLEAVDKLYTLNQDVESLDAEMDALWRKLSLDEKDIVREEMAKKTKARKWVVDGANAARDGEDE